MNLIILAQAVTEPGGPAYLSKLNDWNEQLSGLPGGTLTAIFVGVLTVVLRWLRFFPNAAVPRYSILLGIAMYFCLSSPWTPAVAIQLYIGRGIALGLIISGSVVFVISRFGSKLPIIGQFLVDEPPTQAKDKPQPPIE